MTDMDKKFADSYFRMGAKFGVTKHLGGSFATDELMKLCNVTSDSYILDLGCGAGLATSYIAKKYGCKIMAVDIRPYMIKLAKKNVHDRGVERLVDFKVGDAEKLPFKSNTFDAVITESVIAFTDKKKAIAECVRVCKKGGYVGLNEVTLEKNAPAGTEDFYYSLTGGARLLDKKGWTSLVKGAGLSDIVAKTERLKYLKQFRGEMNIYGLGYMLNAIGKSIKLYFKDPEFKSDIHNIIRLTKKMPKNVMKHTCLGLYVGKKSFYIGQKA